MVDPGLCGSCTNARVIENRRGSTFYLCELAAVDPRFRKYPLLPVLRCDGYREEADTGEAGGSGHVADR